MRENIYMNLVIFSANYLHWVIIGIFTVVLLGQKAARYLLVRRAVIALFLSFLLGKIASSLYYNPRPFVVEKVQPLISHAANNGFPSDHVLLTMTIAAVLFTYNKKVGILSAVLVFIVGFSRVMVLVHHSIDIFAAILIAICSVYLTVFVTEKFLLNPRKQIVKI